jgi:16S rRNA processing protein RimM
MSSTSLTKRTEREDLPATVLVGRVLRPHGVRGEMVVEVLSDVPGRLDPGSALLVADEEGVPLAGPAARRLPARLTVASSRPHRGAALVRFAGFEGRDRAAELAGVWLAVERERVPPAPEGSFYRYELIGCRCFDGERDLGRVVDVVEDGGGLLLIVEGEREAGSEEDGEGRPRQVPVPFVASFLRKVDVAAGEIVLALPPGLVETCESTS